MQSVLRCASRVGLGIKEGLAAVTCRFLENLSFRSLIAPFPEEEFRTLHWEKNILVVERSDPDYYGDLFTLQDFDDAITRAPSYVKIANATLKRNTTHQGATVSGLEGVLADMRDGCTLVLDQLHNYEPKLKQLCRVLATELGHRFQTNLYLTPPDGKGFEPHWDNHDVFILQVLGSKHWQVEKDRRTFPATGEKMGNDGRELRGEIISFTLKQGDLAYIPRGFVHAAACGSEPSLHITLGVSAIFLEDLLHATVKAAVLRDQSLRAALPLGFMNGAREDLVRRVKAAFKDAADDNFLSAVVDQFRDEQVKQFPLDVSGQVANFFQPAPLRIDDIVGPRRGIVYRMHPADDSVRLNFGARSIVFPGFFGPALDFALKRPAFSIRELPGELEDDERVVFTERLIQEGLLVRKSAQ